MTFPRLLLLFAALQLLFVGAVLFRTAPPVPPRAEDSPWRRTAHGWERLRPTSAETQVHLPSLHPMLVATGQCLVCVTILLAAGRPRSRPAPATSSLHGPHYPVPWARRAP